MNQYSILKDVLTDKIYGLALKSIDGFEFMGFNEQSCKWANLANQKQLDISQLPDGIIAEELQDVTEDIATQFNLKIETPLPVVKQKEKLNNFNFKESERFNTGSTTPSITGIPLGEFEKEVRDMVLQFKIKSFQKGTIHSEIALKSRFNQLAFNPSTNRFQPRPNSNFKQIEADELRTKASDGMQRRFGKEITEQINSTIETKWPGEFITGFLLGRRRGRKKRKKMSFKTMEILDFHEKGIGRAIGRAVTPNVGRSRRIGMRASREITGVLDASRRRDVDGDGLIFDGTWREMPDPTRFKPNERVRKPFSPDPNKPIGSQSLQVIEENEKQRNEMSRIIEEASRGVQESIRRGGLASRTSDNRQNRRTEEPIVAAEQEFMDVIDDLIETSEGTSDYFQSLLKKVKNGKLGEEDSDWPDFFQGLLDEFNNGELQGNRRLGEFIKRLSGVDPSEIKRPTRGLSSRAYRPGEDSGAETYLDDIPNMSDDDLKNEIEELEGMRRPYDGNVTQARMDRERIEEMRRELQRRSRGGGRKPIKRRPRPNDPYRFSEEDIREMVDRLRSEAEDSRPGSVRQAVRRQSGNLRSRLPNGGGGIGIRPFDEDERRIQREEIERFDKLRNDAEDAIRNATGSVRQAAQRASETIQGRRQQRGLSDEEGRLGSVRQAAQRASENRRNRGLRSISPDDDPADTLDFDDVSITPDNYRRDRIRSDRERARTSLRVAREEQRNLGKYSKRGKEEIDRAKRNYTNDFINRAKNEIAKSFASNQEGGDDLDSGIRRIAKVLGLDEVETSKLSALLYDVAQSPKSKKEIDSEINQILKNLNDRKIVKGAFDKFAELNDSEDKLISQVKKEITQSYDSNQEGGDDLDSGLRRIAERQGLKKSTTNKLSALLYEIAESPKSKKEIDSKINQIVENPTDREIIKAAFERFSALNNKPEESSLSTSGARSSGRGTRPLPVAMTPNARRAMATTERASSPRGLQSRSNSPKQGKGIPGIDKIGPSDGAQWEALTPDQKTTATAALDNELERVTGELKKRFAGYWRGQVRGAKKQGIRGGRYAPRANDEALTTSDITEMQRQLDSNTSAKPEVRAAVQKQIDAVRLLTTMKSKKDYSMLEQLHPAQKAKVLDALKKTDNFKPLKGFTRTSESTAFKGGAGLSKEDLLTSLTPDVSLDDKKKDKKNVSFRNRILRANPERQRRRELRRQRRAGAIGRTGISLDPELQLKKRKLRAAAFKRQVLSRFRKTKDAEQLADSLGDRKAELHPVQIDADGNIKLAPNFVETMDSLDKRLLEGKKDGDKVYDVLLRDLWENFGYSEVPALVTEEEVKSLLAAGWQPIIRGTGNEEVMSESYVEQFLTSEGRFIAGQGGRAYGVGEYFAYPGGNWSGYSGGADSRHTMLVLIPPTATIMTREELSNEQREMNRLTTAINNEFRIAGDRETVSALSSQEIAQMVRKASPQLAQSKTRSGQILNQLVSRLEELDNMPGDTSQERKRILNTFDLLERMSKKESGHFAPMIGVDAIDTNDGDGSGNPVLLHNRSIVAAFQTPMTRKQAEEMSAGVKKVWTKFKSRNKVAKAEKSDSDSGATARIKPRQIRRAKQPKPQQPAQQSAQAQNQAQKSTSAVDTSSWKTGVPQNVGSNPAKLLTAPDGTEYYAKLPKPNENVQQATERMETEVLASELYKLAGVPTVDLMMGDENGTPQMLSKMIQSRGPNSQSDQDAARAGFVVDAWLANWDAPLNDNIKFDSQNRPVRIDVGGSLDYRAQGAKKDTTRTPFGDSVGEILSMQKNGTFNFTKMDPAEIKKQAQALSTVTDASIRATVSKIVSDPQRAAKLAQTLINRRNDIVARYG